MKNILLITQLIKAMKQADGSLKENTTEQLKRINPLLSEIETIMDIIYKY